MKPRIVLESHNASYADPIKVAKGEFLSLTGREDVWDGQRRLWAAADDGREGWVQHKAGSRSGGHPSHLTHNRILNTALRGIHWSAPDTVAGSRYQHRKFRFWLKAEVPECANLRPVLALKPASALRRRPNSCL